MFERFDGYRGRRPDDWEERLGEQCEPWECEPYDIWNDWKTYPVMFVFFIGLWAIGQVLEFIWDKVMPGLFFFVARLVLGN